jgi:hypothetical protein
MKRTIKLLSLVAVLAFGQSTRAAETADPAAPAGTYVQISTVSCNGNLGVPMTVDEAQSIPLQVMVMLDCGAEVQVLSSFEGYTVSVVAPDGRNGYVARMYLTRPVRRRLDTPVPVENSTPKNGVVRWQAGATGSVQFMSGDKLVESLTANGVTVQVSLQDTGWKMRANVAIVNASQQVLFVLPKLILLEETAPLLRPLRYQDPSEVAKAANHQILWTSASAGTAGNAQQRSSSVSTADMYTVSYKLPSADPAPNYLAQHQALEEMAARNQTALMDMAREINSLALRESTLKPGDKTAGAVWFQRDAKSTQVLLRVPVDGLVFEFPLSFNHDK